MELHCRTEGKRTSCSVLQVLCVTVMVYTCAVTGFNVDTLNFVKYRGVSGSMFGFSVAEYREGSRRWVLVGAPRAQTKQPGVTQGGGVFQCDIFRDYNCSLVAFDRTGNNRNSTGHEIDKKSGQWFGASLYSSADGTAVVACAPRYVHMPDVAERREDPVGTCWVARDDFNHFSEYSPCRTSEWGYHRQGSCQAGLGVSMSKDGKHLFIGAPGSRYWQGEVFSANTTEHSVVVPSAGQLFSQNIHERPNVFSTGEGHESQDNSYLGYSVTVGNFNGDGTPCAAVGRPRGNQLVGMVLLYTWNLTHIGEIVGDQLGAYFGYSLCSSDMDGDGLDDLVVGTPLYTDLQNNEGDYYENGRIYVFYQNEEFEVNHTRDGKNSKSRFGLSLASLGDLNKDGYGDIVVGAPYDGPKEQGAIYIYMGSSKGILEKFSQVIFAEDIFNMNTFGFSLSAGLDLDDNEYPDLVVGAYNSNMAFFFRSRPVVKMNATIKFTHESKQITLDETNCGLQSGAQSICTDLNVCMEYSGVGVDRELVVEVQVILDSGKPKNPRMFFKLNETRSSMPFSFNLTKGSYFCKRLEVFVQPSIRDKLTPLDAEMWYSLKTQDGFYASQTFTGRRRFARSLPPILDMLNEPMDKDTLNIYKNCGKDNICIPDLHMVVKPSVRRYLLGSEEPFKIDVLVENKGEDAFEASYTLKVPLGLNYTTIERLDDRRYEIPVQCSPPTRDTNNTLKCDIGNPLPKGKHVHFKVWLKPFYTEGLRSQYEFFMEVNSTNPENSSSLEDNRRSLEVPITIDTKLFTSGKSSPGEVYWSTVNYSKESFTHEEDVGPELMHIHTIRNRGPADVVEAKVFFQVPTETFTGDNILYLLEQPITSGPIKCEHVPEANYLKLELNNKTSASHTGESSSSSLSSSSARGSSSQSASGSRTSSGHISQSGHVSGGGRGSESGNISGEGRGSESGIISGSGRGSESGVVSGSETGVVSGSGRGSGNGRDREGDNFRGSVSGSESGHVSGSGRDSGSGHVSGSEGAGERHAGFRHRYELHGQTNEGGRVLHRDEGLISNSDDLYGQGVSRTHTQSHHSQNQSSLTNRTEIHGGAGGSRVYESSKYNASWSENGGPTKHFSNFSSSDSDLVRGSGSRHQNGREQGGIITEHHGGGRILYNITAPQRGRGISSDGSEGTLRHYSTDWSSGNEGVQSRTGHHSNSGTGQHTYQHSTSDNVINTDSTGEGHQSRHGEYGNLGGSKVNSNEHGWSQSGDNVEETYHSSDRQYGSSREEPGIITPHYSSSNIGPAHRHGAGRGQYGSDTSSRTNVRQYTSSNWDVNDADHSQHQGSGSGNWHSSTSSDRDNWDRRINEEQGRSRDNTRQYTTTYTWSGDGARHQDVDLSYAAQGPQINTNEQHHEISQGSGSNTRKYTSTSWSTDDKGTKVWHQSKSENYPEEHYTQTSERHYSDSQEVGSDGGKLKLYERYRRDVEEETLADLLQCNATKCTLISCVMGPLTKGKEVQVTLRTRVWVPTMKKLSDNSRVVKTSTRMALQVTTLPYIGSPHKPILESHEVVTDINLTDSPVKPDIVPLWVVVLSAVAGAIILLLLIYLLWKCGFFKRNRPSDAAEKEPLNRNGHYSAGDEAL